MSDSREHLSQKHTGCQLIHYSLNGGRGVRMCACFMFASFMAHVKVQLEQETNESGGILNTKKRGTLETRVLSNVRTRNR